MLDRERHVARIRELLRRYPVVAILGARQVGKTTLAGLVAARSSRPVTTFDLEHPEHLARLSDPLLALGGLRGLVVVDEIQRRPDLFPLLRVLADRPRAPARFLLLGSASLDLVRGSSESLAGRIAYHELHGFDLVEVGAGKVDRLWIRGGLPRSFLAPSDDASSEWRRNYVRTFLERDLPGIGVTIPATTLRRFWTMLAHWHGQVWNASEFGRSFGVADTTVRRYLDLLGGAFVVRLLLPWHANVGKRQVKAPKVYVADSGVLHSLLGLDLQADVESHPKLGGSWEGFALEMTVSRLGARPEEVFFWATHAGAELDLLVVRGRWRLGFEFKRSTSPVLTPSMRIALSDLRLDRLDVVHAGSLTYPLADRVRAVSLARMTEDVEPL